MHELGHLDELIDELINRLDLLKPAYLEEDWLIKGIYKFK